MTALIQVEDSREAVQPGSGDTCEASDPAAVQYPAFEATTTYTGGEIVSYQRLVYQAKWWTRGSTPDSTDAFELISDVLLDYNENTVYEGGDRARYQEKIYEAKWWTRGTTPSDRDPWRLIGDATCQ